MPEDLICVLSGPERTRQLRGYVLVPAGATSIVTADILNAAPLLALGVSSGFTPTMTSANVTAANNQAVVVTGTAAVTVTLPTNLNGTRVRVVNMSTGGTTVSGSPIHGIGLSSAPSFPLGTVGAFAELLGDGSSWYIVAGAQDTGWQALTGLASGVESAASARQIGAEVRLKGDLLNNSGASIAIYTQIATLPLSSMDLSYVTDYAVEASSAVGVVLLGGGAGIQVGQSWSNGTKIYLDPVSYRID